MKIVKNQDNPAQVRSNLCAEELMKDNIVAYDHEGKTSLYKVSLVAPAELFLEPINGVSNTFSQIRCYVYQAEPVPITEDVWSQIPVSMNQVPASIAYVHELQNWYYWNNGKQRLELKMKS